MTQRVLPYYNLGKVRPASLSDGDFLIDSAGKPISASLKLFDQAGHGFTVAPTPVYHNGTIWAKAKADNPDTFAHGVVIYISGNKFIVAESGFHYIIGHGLNPGEIYFTSDSTAGTLSLNKGPVYANPILKVIDDDLIQVLPWPGSLVGDAGASIGLAKIKYETILTSAQATIDFTGLDLDKYGVLFVSADIVSNAASNRCRLFVNGDTSETSYAKNQFFQNAATTVAATEEASGNGTVLNGTLGSSEKGGFIGTVRRIYDGTNTRFLIEGKSFVGNNRIGFNQIYRSVSGDVNINQLTLSSNQTNGLAARTIFRVFT